MKPEAEKAFSRRIQKALSERVWKDNCNSVNLTFLQIHPYFLQRAVSQNTLALGKFSRLILRSGISTTSTRTIGILRITRGVRLRCGRRRTFLLWVIGCMRRRKVPKRGRCEIVPEDVRKLRGEDSILRFKNRRCVNR